jgi:hypothetical protein
VPGSVDAKDTSLYIGVTPACTGYENFRGWDWSAQLYEGCRCPRRTQAWLTALPISFAGAQTMRLGITCRDDSRLCANIVMTSTARAWATVNGGNRTADATASLLSTRLTDDRKLNEREKAIFGEIGHGIVRAIENLRRVRMPLVPCPGLGDGILLSMQDRTGEVSKPRIAKATRASGHKATLQPVGSSG